jgi:hypothetical protein
MHFFRGALTVPLALLAAGPLLPAALYATRRRTADQPAYVPAAGGEYGSGADYRDRCGIAGRYLNVNAGLC